MISNISSPHIESIYIPRASISREGQKVKCSLYGKGFLNVSKNSFEIYCGTTHTEVEIQRDWLAHIKLEIPNGQNAYSVKMKLLDNIQESCFYVSDYSDWNIGDFIDVDGKRLSYEKYAMLKHKPHIAAVICGFNRNGAAVGIGLKMSNPIDWRTKTKPDSWQNEIVFPALNCDISDYIDKPFFSNLHDGSRAWEYIVFCDSEQKYFTLSKENETRYSYPIFNWANLYGENNNLSGDLSKDWYIPSIHELSVIYRNREKIDRSLSLCNGDTLGGKHYWSSNTFQWQRDPGFPKPLNSHGLTENFGTYIVCFNTKVIWRDVIGITAPLDKEYESEAFKKNNPNFEYLTYTRVLHQF